MTMPISTRATTTTGGKPRLFIEHAPREDGALCLLRVEPKIAITSDGEVLLLRYDKLQALAETICQEGAAIQMRTWWTKDGTELVELHRAGAPISTISAPRKGNGDVF
jgi:hypothetical protein